MARNSVGLWPEAAPRPTRNTTVWPLAEALGQGTVTFESELTVARCIVQPHTALGGAHGRNQRPAVGRHGEAFLFRYTSRKRFRGS